MTPGSSTADGPADPARPTERSIGVMQSAARRRLVVFVVGIMVAGIAGRLVDGSEVDATAPGLGQALWLATPLLLGVALSRWGPDRRPWGLRPRLVPAWPWYVLAVVFFPVVTVVLVAVGVRVGSLEAAAGLSLGGVVPLVLAGAAPLVVKNIFEELAWRGYLMAEGVAAGLSTLRLHLFVGVVWGIWHLPYLDAFTALYRETLPALAVPLFLLGVIPTAVVYGEIRLRSGTVWTAVVLHAMANAATNPLFTEDLLAVLPERAWLVGPAVDNLGYVVVLGLAAAAMAWLRLRSGSPAGIGPADQTGRTGPRGR
jgi:membrane protease YdiL (CAAX protease family)